jgi:uncharacterized protein YjbI with pentapeptide repeats
MPSYQQLMEGVYDRDWENKRKHEGLGDFTADEFMLILEEIAVCAWQGGDARITTERKIEKYIKDKDTQYLLEQYKASVKGGVSRLLTAFYFRKYGKEDSESKDDTFEFTHKSFGEYLTARAIVGLIKATHEERIKHKKKASPRRGRREGWAIQQCLLEWLKTTCQNPLDDAIRAFIKNEILIRKEEGDDIGAWQASLAEVISELVVTGMPLHLQEQRFTQLEEMRLARNAEEALLVALACCAEVTEQLSSIEWEDADSFSQWLSRLSSSMTNRDFAFKHLVYLDLKGVDLGFANLSSSNLYKSNLEGASLWGADLRDANLWGAVLSGAVLSGLGLRGADLRGVVLSYANLMDASLTLNQLLSTRSLYEATGIREDWLAQIKQKKPSLLEWFSWLKDGL